MSDLQEHVRVAADVLVAGVAEVHPGATPVAAALTAELAAMRVVFLLRERRRAVEEAQAKAAGGR